MKRINENILTAVSFRPFGVTGNELDIDFDQPARPQLVTEILTQCTASQTTSAAFFWDFTIGQRIEALLRLAAVTNVSRFDVELVCTNPICARQIEVELTVAELVNLQRQATPKGHLTLVLGGKTVSLRRPTGTDQLEWQQYTFSNEQAARGTMIRTLLSEPVTDNITEAEITLIDEAMQEYDPLVGFSLQVCCPHCEEIHTHAIDLQELILTQFAYIQQQLLEDVHHLALCYHWSEAQIMALTPQRRARYLDLLERERVL